MSQLTRTEPIGTEMVSIRIKVGNIEVECCADRNFVVNYLPSFSNELAIRLQKLAILEGQTSPLSAAKIGQNSAEQSFTLSKAEISTSSIAAALSAKSGGDLLIAASAHLTFIKGREILDRREILAEMRNATAYFKRTYSNNFSVYLTSLVREGKLIERSAGSYSLSAACRDEIQSAITSL